MQQKQQPQEEEQQQQQQNNSNDDLQKIYNNDVDGSKAMASLNALSRR